MSSEPSIEELTAKLHTLNPNVQLSNEVNVQELRAIIKKERKKKRKNKEKVAEPTPPAPAYAPAGASSAPANQSPIEIKQLPTISPNALPVPQPVIFTPPAGHQDFVTRIQFTPPSASSITDKPGGYYNEDSILEAIDSLSRLSGMAIDRDNLKKIQAELVQLPQKILDTQLQLNSYQARLFFLKEREPVITQANQLLSLLKTSRSAASHHLVQQIRKKEASEKLKWLGVPVHLRRKLEAQEEEEDEISEEEEDESSEEDE